MYNSCVLSSREPVALHPLLVARRMPASFHVSGSDTALLLYSTLAFFLTFLLLLFHLPVFHSDTITLQAMIRKGNLLPHVQMVMDSLKSSIFDDYGNAGQILNLICLPILYGL